LIAHFGKAGAWFYEVARGIDERPVQPFRQRKSVGTERTFSKNLEDRSAMLTTLQGMAEQVVDRLQTLTLAGHTIHIKARFPDFTTVTRALTTTGAIGNKAAIATLLPDLLDRAVPVGASVRLLGITVSGLTTVQAATRGEHQIELLDEIPSQG
ncbi:MAG: DNA polymerase IV, partial [Desulfomonilaceae bacterium]